jgi:hypothetical protein
MMPHELLDAKRGGRRVDGKVLGDELVKDLES